MYQLKLPKIQELEMLMWSLLADGFHFPGRCSEPTKKGSTSLAYMDLGKKIPSVNQDNIRQSENGKGLQFSNYFEGLVVK